MKKFVKYFSIFLVVITIVFFALGMFIPSFTFKNKIQVNSPIGHTFAVFENVNKMKDWMPGFKSIALTGGLPFMPGSTYDLVLVQDGKEMVMKETLTALRTNDIFSFSLDNDVLHTDVSVHFTANGDKTDITAESMIEGKGMFWKSMMVFAKGSIIQKQQAMYDALKKVIESSPEM